MKQKILMIATSHSKMGTQDRATGLWAEELMLPYCVLVDAGYEVVIASPNGGPVPVDPGSIKPAGSNAAPVDRFLRDAGAMAKIKATLRTSDIKPDDYAALYIPGGHGTMWDLPVDKATQTIVEHYDRAGKPIAAVCHGVSGLLSAKNMQGRALVAGRRVNGFTNSEEAAAGLTDVVPFLLETKLRELGAQFESAADWQPFAVRDGHMITGQNPQSSRLVAEHLLELLKLSKA